MLLETNNPFILSWNGLKEETPTLWLMIVLPDLMISKSWDNLQSDSSLDASSSACSTFTLKTSCTEILNLKISWCLTMVMLNLLILDLPKNSNKMSLQELKPEQLSIILLKWWWKWVIISQSIFGLLESMLIRCPITILLSPQQTSRISWRLKDL